MVTEEDAFALQPRNRYLRTLEDNRDWPSTTFRDIEWGLCLCNRNYRGQDKDSHKTPNNKFPFSLFYCYHGRFLLFGFEDLVDFYKEKQFKKGREESLRRSKELPGGFTLASFGFFVS
jgi:hypothetical protein